jgi:CoA:oxalate CoA-transferase
MSESNKLPLPLKNLRVLDATHIVAGPFCSMILGDMGAEVIKIERPGVGEQGRGNQPFIENANGERMSARFLGVNRNKKSISIDLRDPRAKIAFETMLKESDVLLDNWGPGALGRLGYSWDNLHEINPGLVYVTITGYGAHEDYEGPYSQWPANNPCVQGMGGWMESTGAPDGPPQMVGDNMGDSIPGVWAALGMMMALETKRQTGKGQHVDTAMYDCMAAHTTSTMPYYQATGIVTTRARENMISAQLTLKTSDGYVVLAGARGHEKWKKLWALIDRNDLANDERYLGDGTNGQFYFDYVVPAIENWSASQTKKHVAETLVSFGFSMGMVQDVKDLDECPHLAARDMFVETGDTLGGTFRTVDTPIKLTSSEKCSHTTPPKLGQDNYEILTSLAKLSEEQIKELEADGVI